MSFIIIILALLVAFIFGMNNSSLCMSGLTGSGIFTYRKALLLTMLGFFLGSFLEGNKMQNSLVGSVIENITYKDIGIFNIFGAKNPLVPGCFPK